jgi:hypothetical protein
MKGFYWPFCKIFIVTGRKKISDILPGTKSNYSIKMRHGEKRLLKDKGEEQPNRSYYKRHVSNLHFIFVVIEAK